jgi:hypothetical protein
LLSTTFPTAAAAALAGTLTGPSTAALPMTRAIARRPLTGTGSMPRAALALTLARALTRSLTGAGSRPAKPHRATAGPLAIPVALELPSASAARLADREIRQLPLWYLAFRTWKRGANQPPMDGTLVITGCRNGRSIGLGGIGRCGGVGLG